MINVKERTNRIRYQIHSALWLIKLHKGKKSINFDLVFVFLDGSKHVSCNKDEVSLILGSYKQGIILLEN